MIRATRLARSPRWLAVAAAVAVAALAWQARALLLPCLASLLLAGACAPAIASLQDRGLPRPAAAALLAMLAVVVVAAGVSAVRAMAPSPADILQLKLRATHALVAHYANGLRARLPAAIHHEADSLAAKSTRHLALTREENELLAARALRNPAWAALRDEWVRDALAARALAPAIAGEGSVAQSGDGSDSGAPVELPLRSLARGLPIAGVAALVFLLALFDGGRMWHALFRLVPNRLFEPALAIAAGLEDALRRYAVAVFQQCMLLGTAIAAALAIAGVLPRWAAAIGLFAGVVNFFPYAGIATALAASVAYVILGGAIHSPLPFITSSDGVPAVMGAIAAVALLKNAWIDPTIMGRALTLHPVVVVLGVATGAELFGFAGALLAMPVTAVAWTVAGTLFDQMRSVRDARSTAW